MPDSTPTIHEHIAEGIVLGYLERVPGDPDRCRETPLGTATRKLVLLAALEDATTERRHEILAARPLEPETAHEMAVRLGFPEPEGPQEEKDETPLPGQYL